MNLKKTTYYFNYIFIHTFSSYLPNNKKEPNEQNLKWINSPVYVKCAICQCVFFCAREIEREKSWFVIILVFIISK